MSIIRNINQVIVREKEVKKLLQECCNILTSQQVYGYAWVMTIDDKNEIEYIFGADTSEKFITFTNKIKEGWKPYCTVKTDKEYSYIHNTEQTCVECPLKNVYESEGAFNIALKHENKLYGYLNLSLEKQYLLDKDELSMLEEVAGNIAYALYNLKVEKDTVDLKKLYENIINSVDNLIFVKDINFKYIACNGAFEKFIGKSKEDIIGKNDFDIFDEEVAQFFRDHDEAMLLQQKPVSNFEWVTYPDGSKKYLLTVKSPMFDEHGNIFALVGNSADITEKKEAEIALQISNEKFEKAFNNTPNIIIISNLKTGKIYDVNKTFEIVLGYKKEEIIGKTTFDID